MHSSVTVQIQKQTKEHSESANLRQGQNLKLGNIMGHRCWRHKLLFSIIT